MVAEAVGKAQPGEWIVGRGWHQDKWQHAPNPSVEGLQTHHALSEVSQENPVMLIHTSGHGVFVNARALQSSA
jgi:predicted amidohydrolase YtcJ